MGKVLSTPNSNLTWRRDLIGSKLVIWNNLTSRLATVALTHEDDEFWWNLDSTGVFSVKSYYQGLIFFGEIILSGFNLSECSKCK